MRRWICPRCGGGVNAPERPRKNDVRRYCLKCSEETGFLMERCVPALERKRAVAYVRGSERAAQKREAERQKWVIKLPDANRVTRDLDVRGELRRALKDCGFFDGWARGQTPTMDEVEIVLRRGRKPYHSGRAWESSFRVAFTFGLAGYEDGLELIYHEAAHLAGRKWRRARTGLSSTPRREPPEALAVANLRLHSSEGRNLLRR